MQRPRAAPGFADVEGTEPVEGDAELRQCDTRAIAETLGVDPDAAPPRRRRHRGHQHRAAQPRHRLRRLPATATSPAPSAPDECDPWLANFQKILTDGDPDGNGVREEVPYQPLLPDAVKIRGQVATGQSMAELQPVRLRDNDGDGIDDPSSAVAVPLRLRRARRRRPRRASRSPPGMRFRHLPPYFVRDLENRQRGGRRRRRWRRPRGRRHRRRRAPRAAWSSPRSSPRQQRRRRRAARVRRARRTASSRSSTASTTTTSTTPSSASASARAATATPTTTAFERDEGDDDEEGVADSAAPGAELALWGPLGMALLVPVRPGTRRRSN